MAAPSDPFVTGVINNEDAQDILWPYSESDVSDLELGVSDFEPHNPKLDLDAASSNGLCSRCDRINPLSYIPPSTSN